MPEFRSEITDTARRVPTILYLPIKSKEKSYGNRQK